MLANSGSLLITGLSGTWFGPRLKRAGLTVLSLLLCLNMSGIAAEEDHHSVLIDDIRTQWTGDLDGMVRDRVIRVLVVYNKTMYFLNGADQHGITYDFMIEFEKFVNEHSNSGDIPVRVVFIPVTRDRLFPALIDGYGDIAAANLTITDERSKLVDFTNPYLEGVDELLVTGSAAEEVASIDDLSGKLIHVRPSSSYYENLSRLNDRFVQRGMEPIELIEADEHLEDADLLEMVNAGIIGMVVVDSHKAHFWKDVFQQVVVHDDIAVNTDGRIAWAIRKNSPGLAGMANRFIKTSKKGTLLGNILYKRYLQDNQWVKNSVAEQEIDKFEKVAKYLKKYAQQYEFDWLMLAALGYQESGLDQTKRSDAGAIGVMQLLPSTAADPNVDIPKIKILENNIHAGTKYLRFLKDRYFSNSGIDDVNQTLLAFAAYNAGPARVSKLRERAQGKGLDPNVWFDHVEVIAAKEIGAETITYVSNIYKYYIAYKLYVEQLDARGSLGIDD